MSGHSKWSTIKRKKGAADAKRGQAFTKLGKALTIASREGGGDPDTNFSLRLVVDKARQANMPMENIERAIKRGTGEIEGASTYERGVYGGYGPGGVAVVVDVLADNKNRTVSEIRMIFENHSGNMADAASVVWQFQEKGLVVVKCAKPKAAEQFGKEATVEKVDPDTVMMEMIDVPGVEDVQDGGTEEETGLRLWEVLSSAKDLAHVRDGIEKLGYIVSSSEIVRIPSQTQAASSSDIEKLDRLVEALEDQDDVESVWTTVEQ